MLLDRKRIRKWARWVALILAIIFCVGAVGIGVGQGTGNMNVFEALSCGNPQTATNNSLDVDQRIAALQATLAQNPKDVTTLQALATAYEEKKDYTNAAKYLEQAITVDPNQEAVYFRLAALYTATIYDYNAAVVVMNKAQALWPNDPNVYLQLGLAQRSQGKTSAAILAWQEYLRLDPNGDQAEAIREAIATMSANATTTTSTSTTSTTAGSTSSTTGSNSSTTASTAGSASTTSSLSTTTTASPSTTAGSTSTSTP